MVIRRMTSCPLMIAERIGSTLGPSSAAERRRRWRRLCKPALAERSEITEQKGNARDRSEAAGNARDALAECLARHADQEADADADSVQHGRGQHEADAILEAGGIERHLRAVGMTVEDGEQTDPRDGHRERSFDA